jgi:hypothetical protein
MQPTPHPDPIMVAVGAAVYVLPTVVALLRRHRNALAIAVLNLCLGCTIIGWVAALIWACIVTSPARTRDR